MKRRSQGFTLIEMMVALVAGSIATLAAFQLGTSISRQFYSHQRVSYGQGAARVSLQELRRDISRAGLFGTPNADKEIKCEDTPELPKVTGGTLPISAFQYYPDYDTGILDDHETTTRNTSANPGVRADRLRVLTNLSITDSLTVESIKEDASRQRVYFDETLQSFRRTFLWGISGEYGTSQPAQYFLEGDKNFTDATGSSIVRYSARGERAFALGTVLHLESPNGHHFFRTVFGLDNEPTTGRIGIELETELPLGEDCLPDGTGMIAAPLEWVEYVVIDPFSDEYAGFMDFDGVLSGGDAVPGLSNFSANNSSPNPMLVRRRLDATSGDPTNFGTQVIAEYVSDFKVSFLVDRSSGTNNPPDLLIVNEDPGSPNPAASAVIEASPEQVRSVIIELSVRAPVEDPNLDPTVANNDGTRFDINPNAKGGARVQKLRVEVPVPNVGRRNL